MKKIVVFGAGLVASAHVNYLLDHGYQVTVASRTVAKAQEIVGNRPNGKAIAFDIEKEGDVRLDQIVAEHDLAVSLLPYIYHPRVARSCLRNKKHMVTTSYVKDEMRSLDAEAKKLGLILLNEIGVDPGIDHMTAMKIIHDVQSRGGKITSFTSYCGGLPAPESNDNPFGYKFSWSPRGVLMAGRNPARFLRAGKTIDIPGPELFDNFWPVPVWIEGKQVLFEGYPNRDSLPYMETYGITNPVNFFRGTLRNTGWCTKLKKFVELGLLDDAERSDLEGATYAQYTAKLVGSADTKDLQKKVAARLGVAPDSQIIQSMEWLGLFSDQPLPADCKSPLDIMTATMLSKMVYTPSERDMLILQHQFEAEFPDHKEKIVSTMLDFGIPNGASSMNRTVGLPAAVGAHLILQGKIKSTGVLVPVIPEIYEPALAELQRLGIHFLETKQRV